MNLELKRETAKIAKDAKKIEEMTLTRASVLTCDAALSPFESTK